MVTIFIFDGVTLQTSNFCGLLPPYGGEATMLCECNNRKRTTYEL